MGWDMAGEVEVRPSWHEGMEDLGLEPWVVALHAWLIVGRSYKAFHCLFGATIPQSRFEPVAANRGLPPDLSKEVREDARRAEEADPAGFCWPSWVTWAELEQVDWDEIEPDSLAVLRRFVRDGRGEWVRDSEVPVDDEMDEAIFGPDSAWVHGQEWLVGDRLFRAVYPTRRDELNEEWWSLFAIMRELAKRFTPEGVRLVVWFTF
jgi:hypothetical protein